MKKTFKDFLQQDVRSTFLNVLEFGEPANINGNMINVVIDEESLKEQNLSKGEKLAKGELLFYVSTGDFEHIPQVDKLMSFNSKKYRIIEVTEQIGVLTIMLARLRA